MKRNIYEALLLLEAEETAADTALATDSNTMKGATGEFFTALFLVDRSIAPGITVTQDDDDITYPAVITDQWKSYGTNPKNSYSCLDRATAGKKNFTEFNNIDTQSEAKEIADMIYQHRGEKAVAFADVTDAAIAVGADSEGGQGDIIVTYPSDHPDPTFAGEKVPWSLKVGSSKPGLQNQGAGYLADVDVGINIPIRETVLEALSEFLDLQNPTFAEDVAFDDDIEIQRRVFIGAQAAGLADDECLITRPKWKKKDGFKKEKMVVKLADKGNARIYSTPEGWIGLTYEDGIAKLANGKIVLVNKTLYGTRGTEPYFTTVVGKKLGNAMVAGINSIDKFKIILSKVIKIADIGDSNKIPVLVGSPGAAKEYKKKIKTKNKTDIEAVIKTEQLYPNILELKDQEGKENPLLKFVKTKKSGNNLFFACDKPKIGDAPAEFMPLFETSLRKSGRSGSIFSLKFDVRSVTYPKINKNFDTQTDFKLLGEEIIVKETRKYSSLMALFEDLEIPESVDGDPDAFEAQSFVDAVEDEIIDSKESPISSPEEVTPALSLDVGPNGPVYPHPSADPTEFENLEEIGDEGSSNSETSSVRIDETRWLKLAGLLKD